MFRNRAFLIGLFFTFGLIAGCSHSSREAESVPGGTTAASFAPAQPPADTATADALALKVTTYRRDVEKQMQEAAERAAATRPVAVAPDTRPILATENILSADSMRFSIYPQENTAPARQAAQPRVTVADVTPPQPAPGEAMMANFPISVPEGHDHPDSAGQAQEASATQSPVLSADLMERRLAQHLRDDPKDLEGQLDYELLLFIEGQPVPQMTALAGLRSEDREVLAAVMDGLSNFRSVVRADNNALLATKTQPLIDMSNRLRTQAELSLNSVVLCSEVKSFGVYKPVDTGWFKAGRANDTQVVVYCQVQSFQSRLSGDGQYQTQLSEEMTLYTEAGVQVWPDKSHPQLVNDLCRQQRRDLYVANLVTIPHTLPAGRYLLKISITDQEADRIAEATSPLVIMP